MDITRRAAREALGVNDAGLAKFFGVSPSAVSQWGEDDPLPLGRQWQARAKRPDVFGPPHRETTIPVAPAAPTEKVA